MTEPLVSDAVLDIGWHPVRLVCPDCGDWVTVAVELTALRQHATDEPITLQVKARSKKVDHQCGQGRLFGGVPE